MMPKGKQVTRVKVIITLIGTWWRRCATWFSLFGGPFFGFGFITVLHSFGFLVLRIVWVTGWGITGRGCWTAATATATAIARWARWRTSTIWWAWWAEQVEQIHKCDKIEMRCSQSSLTSSYSYAYASISFHRASYLWNVCFVTEALVLFAIAPLCVSRSMVSNSLSLNRYLYCLHPTEFLCWDQSVQNFTKPF